jgi:hypothetical protein
MDLQYSVNQQASLTLTTINLFEIAQSVDNKISAGQQLTVVKGLRFMKIRHMSLQRENRHRLNWKEA